MRVENVRIIAGRELRTRLRSKGFWISTIALPLFLAAVLLLPALLLTRTSSTHRLVIVDRTGAVGELLIAELTERGAIGDLAEIDGVDAGESPAAGFLPRLEPPAADATTQRADLDRRVRTGEIDAWVWITEESLAEDRIEYHSENVSNFVTQARLEAAGSAAVRRHRLEQAGLDAEQIDRLGRSVGLTTVRVTEQGSREEGFGSGLSLAYFLFFALYMSLLIYGQQVMTGVIEEKSSRIVEVIVATTRPFELMLGKLLGICGVALTQMGIWLGTVAALTAPSVVATMSWLPEGVELPTLSAGLLLHFLAFFLLGFFLFSTFYGSIGAAFNNVQEAQQFASVAAIFLVAPMLLFWMVINDPDSPLAVVTSLIPFFTPLLLMLRIAIKEPPLWQIALGYLLTTGFTVLMVWVSSRVYRIGILMYGKKPSLQELWRWVRHA